MFLKPCIVWMDLWNEDGGGGSDVDLTGVGIALILRVRDGRFDRAEVER
jgi:hypothetical protein